MPRIKMRTLIVTGKTERQWIDELRVLELAHEQGIKSPKIRTCYLCKREEGENSLCLYADREDEVSLKPIELIPYVVEVEEEATFEYLLCSECLILLSSMDGTELEYEG
jgi:hypothetical protein